MDQDRTRRVTPSTNDRFSPSTRPVGYSPKSEAHSTKVVEDMRRPDEPIYYLITKEGYKPGTVHRIDREIITVGLDPSNEICLPTKSVAQRHTKITITKEGIHVRDMVNPDYPPTLVNGSKVETKALQENDELTIGENVLVLIILK